VKQAGGIVIAQDEATSEWFSMPRSAIDTGVVDYVLPLDRIGAKLVGLLDHRAGLTWKGATS
jgi:two-component system chemotaxis response regulator CheB